MNMRELVLKLVEEPDNELEMLMKQMDKEQTCENLERMALDLSRMIGKKVLEGAVQLRADVIEEMESTCPHCREKETLLRASFSPEGQGKKGGRRK